MAIFLFIFNESLFSTMLHFVAVHSSGTVELIVLILTLRHCALSFALHGFVFDGITYLLDTIQDFLCKLAMKPHMHLVEMSSFSLNHVIVKPTKIIKDLCEAST